MNKLRAAGCTRYIDVTRGAFINKFFGGDSMATKDNACAYSNVQELGDIKLYSQKPLPFLKEDTYLGVEDERLFASQEASLHIIPFLT